jgi:hypothetical protein
VLEGLYEDLARCRKQLDAAAAGASASLLAMPLPRPAAAGALPFVGLQSALLLMGCLAAVLGLPESPWTRELAALAARHPEVHDGRYDVAAVYRAAPPRPPGAPPPRLTAGGGGGGGSSGFGAAGGGHAENATASLVERRSAAMTLDGEPPRAAAGGGALLGGPQSGDAGACGGGDTAGALVPSGGATGAPSASDIQQYVRQRADAQLQSHLKGLAKLVALRSDMRGQCAALQGLIDGLQLMDRAGGKGAATKHSILLAVREHDLQARVRARSRPRSARCRVCATSAAP